MHDGSKMGESALTGVTLAASESPKWRWENLQGGKQKFTFWDEFGKVKAKSIWKDRKILNYELAK